MSIFMSALANPTDPVAAAIRIRDTLQMILETGDIVGEDRNGRTLLQLTLNEIQLEELAVFGTELEDLEADPTEDDEGV